MTLSEFLIEKRHEHCLTQDEVAKKIGVTRVAYSGYEKGRISNGYKMLPSPKTARKIATLYGVDTSEIAKLIENEKKGI